ncbi:B12-binding domain-containing radical SAM protein [Cylindrospermum sp. FACHB-282]|uniref:B12-binding domain-containing radical SAM protein n=1 Tax=Cylindrospermum sp. FACHB-282 TaxID=2692794 RepID=UPI0016820979|nr:B12-binding domain-containing radical SAM protein [Cylindrospermum sp. FACHB-282]MBD2384527.1 B12-binding domain-containing radical SAM protein [Cylindrospermum sp. FACHB-282]
MRALLLWPIMPNSFWSYQETLDLAGLRSTNPPLGLITVAAMLPSDWEIRFSDRNVRLETDADWAWCDLVIISAMIIQQQDLGELIKKAVALGKKVAVGGPFPTSVPEFALEAGANYLILDEGECTVPMFLEALERGEERGVFRSSEKPDVTQTPIPRFDLLDLNAYYAITVQFSRGCPFQCEFCDIINLFGRKPRTKTPEQMLAELEVLYQMGWHRYVFLVDDNFIGNKRNAKVFLRALIPWMEERKYPFTFITEASLNLAEDDELIDLMVKAGITIVFMGIETPDVESLVGINKEQNTRQSLQESCDKITRAGLQIMSGFIIGFDNERAGAGTRIQDFVEETGIPQAHLSLLGALPNTAMWTRLQKEGRLLEGFTKYFTSQKSLMNFVPTRPMAEVVNEFITTFWNLYEPLPYLKRTFRHFIMMEGWRPQNKRQFTWQEVRFFFAICWRQGVVRSTRWRFWWQLVAIALQKPHLFYDYLIALGVGEHFFNFRHEVKAQLEAQLEDLQHQPVLEASYQLSSAR